NNSAWLGFQDGVNITNNEPVTISGTTATQLVNGVIRNVGGNNSFGGTISAGGNLVAIGADSGSLTLTQAINSTVGATAEAVRVVGGGTVVLSAAQTYAGVTRVVPANDSN